MTRNTANSNGPKPLEKSFRILAIVNIILGAFAIILQFAVIFSWISIFADLISTGVWGGSFFIATGATILRRKYAFDSINSKNLINIFEIIS